MPKSEAKRSEKYFFRSTIRSETVSVQLRFVSKKIYGKNGKWETLQAGAGWQFHACLYNLEALLTVDGVDEDEAVNVYAVLGGEDAVLVLSGRVHHQHLVLLAPHLDGLVERVLYRRIIGVNKLSLNTWLLLIMSGTTGTLT